MLKKLGEKNFYKIKQNKFYTKLKWTNLVFKFFNWYRIKKKKKKVFCIYLFWTWGEKKILFDQNICQNKICKVKIKVEVFNFFENSF